jgi:hypothetical protein
MRIIKLGLISIVFFSIFLTLFSFLFPSHIRISKATDITAPRDSLVAQLSKPANWKSWFPGSDSATYHQMNGNIDGITTRDGNDLIIESTSDSLVIATYKGNSQRETKTGWNIFEANTPGAYTVQWYMDVHLRWYPWEKFSGLLMEKRYGPMMEQGLQNLKNLLEK